MVDGLRWRIGNGSKVRFWIDNWADKPLITWGMNLENAVDTNVLIKDVLRDGVGWDIDKLNRMIPADFVARVVAHPVPRLSSGPDKLIWNHTNNGLFTTQSAYVRLLPNSSTQWHFRWIWKLQCPLRWIHFAWLLSRERLMTNDVRLRWGLSDNGSCTICNATVEDINHVFRHCPRMIEIWGHTRNILPSATWEEWFWENLKSKQQFYGMDWGIVFLGILWYCWKNRCTRTIGDSADAETHLDSGDSIVRMVLSCCEHFKRPPGREKQHTLISWNKPPPLWRKLNTDEALCGRTGLAGTGGVIRDEHGTWIAGFQQGLGTCSSVEAELSGLRLGLELAWNLGERKLIAEVDAEVLLELCSPAISDMHPLGGLIADIQHLRQRNWEVKLVHTLREGNFCADLLAKKAIGTKFEMSLLTTPPQEIDHILANDARGVLFPRGFKIS